MEFNRDNILKNKTTTAKTAAATDEGLRAYMLKVYNYMSTGVLLTGIIALLTFKMSVVTSADGSIVALTEIGNAIYLSAVSYTHLTLPTSQYV